MARSGPPRGRDRGAGRGQARGRESRDERVLCWGVDVLAYGRSSSDEQERSCAQQVAAIEKHAREQGWLLEGAGLPRVHCPEEGVYLDDAVSGWKHTPRERDGSLALLRYCDENRRSESDLGLIIIWALSRLGRFVRGPQQALYWIEWFRERGWVIRSLTQNLDGADQDRLMVVIRAALESEKDTASSEEKSKGVARGKQDLIQLGVWHGGVAPIGYERWAARVEGRRVVQWIEELPGRKRNPYPDAYTVLRPGNLGDTVKRLFRGYGDGIDAPPATQEDLARLWNAEGVPIRRRVNKHGEEVQGKAWYHTTIGKVLGNEAYRGIQRDEEGNQHRALWEPLVDRDLWERVQERRRLNHRRGKGASSIYLLSGLLHCATCGEVMHGDATDGVAYYKAKRVAPGSERCGACRQRIRADVIEPVVLEVVPQLADHPICRRRIEEEREALRGGAAQARNRARDLEDQVRERRGQMERLVDALAVGGAAAEAIQDRMTRLNAEIDRIERERARLRAGEAGRLPTAERAAEANLFVEAFRQASQSERKDLLVHLVARVDVDFPTGRVAVGFRRPRW